MTSATTQSKKASRRNMLVALSAALVVVTAGYILVLTKAAGFFASVDPVSTTLSGNAALVTESDGSKSVQFNAPVVMPPPSGSTTCPLPKYPDASCTGVPAGTALTVVNSGMNITTPNTLIEGKDIRGCVYVHVPGVIIRKSKISCAGSNEVLYNDSTSGTGLLVEDSEIDCMRQSETGITYTNYTARRVKVHGCENVMWAENNIVVEDSYLYDVNQSFGSAPHTDGIQIPQNVSNITIRHNTIYGYDETNHALGSSAITGPKAYDGYAKDITIADNLLAGGSYALYCYQYGTSPSFYVTNNHFSTKFSPKVGAYGPWDADSCKDEHISGNVYHETGQPLPLN